MTTDRWRWCTGGPPEPPRLDHFRANLGAIPGGAGLVACGCHKPWTCNDPDTISRGEETILRKRRRERCPQTSADLFVDRV